MIENLFLSAGAMKAGTTWVYDKLQHNPKIEFCHEKEIYYFSHIDGVASSLDSHKRIRRANQAIKKAGRDIKSGDMTLKQYNELVNWYLNYAASEINDSWYLDLFSEKVKNDKDAYCADFSNLTCFLSQEGWQHVRSLAKNIKVIYILRNPLERFWSHYKFHLQFIKHSEMSTPDENVKLFNRITSKKWFIRNSLYSENIKAMQEVLSPNEFKIYYLDDISAEPEKYLGDIERFLGVIECDYSNLGLSARKNSSIKKAIPEEWVEAIQANLKDELLELREMGLWHEAWG